KPAASLKLSRRQGASQWHLHHFQRLQTYEKLPGPVTVKFWIAGIDADEEPMPTGELKRGRVKKRVVWHRQPVEREHPEQRRNTREQDRQLERDGNPRRQ